MEKITYYTDGSVRGRCSHKHRTIDGALHCLTRDQAGCAEHGGYSDREIYDSTGRYIATTTDEDGNLIVEEN